MATKAQLENEYYNHKSNIVSLRANIERMERKISDLDSARGPNFDPSREISNLQGSINHLKAELSSAEVAMNNAASKLDRGDYDKPPKYD